MGQSAMHKDQIKKMKQSSKKKNGNQLPPLAMDDILFGLMEEAIRRIEPTVMSFEKEVDILKNLAQSLTH